MLPPEKQEVFKRLWLSGVKESEIARILGLRVNTVTIYAKILGLPPRSRRPPPNKKIKNEDIELIKEMWFNGATVKEIAEYFGVHETTILCYLHAMGLKRRTIRRCPDIPRDVLERLSLKGYTDEEIARIYNTSKNCVMRLRQKYGINKRVLVKRRRREKINKIIDMIVSYLNEKGYITSIELREKHGIRVDRKLLEELESDIDGIRWFKLKYTSTAKFSVFPVKFNNMTIIYLEGNEDKVIAFLLNNTIDKNVPLKVMKYLLKANSAPEGIINAL